MENLFYVPETVRLQGNQESFTPLLQGQGELLVERIVSYGHTTPEGEWYAQERDEWVTVLEGEAKLGYEDGREVTLGRGDHVFLPKYVRHRVAYTSSPCIWLAVHGANLTQARDVLSGTTGNSTCATKP